MVSLKRRADISIETCKRLQPAEVLCTPGFGPVWVQAFKLHLLNLSAINLAHTQPQSPGLDRSAPRGARHRHGGGGEADVTCGGEFYYQYTVAMMIVVGWYLLWVRKDELLLRLRSVLRTQNITRIPERGSLDGAVLLILNSGRWEVHASLP